MDHGTRLGIPSDPFYSQSFRDVENKSGYMSMLRSSRDILLPLFRDLDAVRITLAKHEIPKIKGLRAQAPGYARIDMTNGSLNWMILHRDGSAQIITRKELADGCRHLRYSAPRRKASSLN